MRIVLNLLGTYGAMDFAYRFGPTVWEVEPAHLLTLSGMSMAVLLLLWGGVK